MSHSDTPTIREEQSELAGYAVTRVVRPEAELLRLAVRPDRQRLGIGSALMRRTLEQLADSGVSVCFLEARADNHAALALYRHFTATQRAVRSSYFRDGYDALILAIEIQDWQT